MRAKLQRSVALALSILFVLGSFITGVSATDTKGDGTGTGGSVTDKTIEDVKELLNAISYEEYLEKYSDKTLYPKAAGDIVIDCLNYNAEKTDALVKKETYDGIEALYVPAEGTVSFDINVPSTAKYAIMIDYYPVEGKSTSIERIFKVNGTVPFSEAYYITLTKVWTTTYDEANKKTIGDGDIRLFKTDVDNNEIRAAITQTPEWRQYSLKDIDGFYKDSFEFVFEAGTNTISFTGVNEPIAIKTITLYPYADRPAYDEYIKQYANEAKGTDKIKIEAEYPYRTSTNTIYPIEDRSSAVTSPADTKRTLLNTIGGDKWQTSGQWVSYQFTVESSGMYEIVPRFKQSINDGMYSSRVLYVYSDDTVKEGEKGYYNGIPFDEAALLRFNYSTDWQAAPLQYGITTTDAKGNEIIEYADVEFYFKAGVTYTIELEVALGTMGDVVREVSRSLGVINEAYLNIMKLTGSNPDEYRNYFFSSVMPDTIINIILESNNIEEVAAELTSLAGVKSSNVATLEKVAWLLDRMGSDEEQIAKNLEQLKSYIGSLGTWLSESKTQPLQLDYIMIQSADEALPRAKANFFQAFGHEFSSFIQSFFRNYNRMGATAESLATDESVEVWLAYGRDQTQVIRNLINNDFTPNSNIMVNLKLVAGGTLLPSILAQRGPDVYIGLGDDSVINYAIRGALLEVEDEEGFEEIATTQFNEAAMLVLGIDDADGVYHCYGLPETQSFPMMFIRKDILADLGIDIPKTWDDVLNAVTILQQNYMTIGLNNDYKIFLYQMGGTLFADEGMRINLDSNVALDSFETMCNMFTMYSFPYKFDFANRFRTGEMPIGIASYSSTYNHLIVFATELRGLWQFVPMPGYEYTAADGTTKINNVSVSSVSAIVMINGCKDEGDAWDFMKWHVGAECQVNYSNEMVAILGDSAKHATANITALESMPWTHDEYENLSLQFNNLASIPNYPGAYIIGRYTKFAFLDAYNDRADPVTELLSYITTINKEITRKRSEFGLETLEIGQTLASKRRDMILDENRKYGTGFTMLSEADAAAYSAQITAVKDALAAIPTFSAYCEDTYIDALRAAGDALKAANPELFATICTYITNCADSLKSYQASYPMG